MSQAVFDKIKAKLDEVQADYRIIVHSSEGKSEEVARLRGTTAHQGAKAMLYSIKGTNQFVLAVLPGDMRVNVQALAARFSVKKNQLSLATQVQITATTDCVIGCVPPFTFSENVKLVVAPELLAENKEIAFNAGLLTHSIVVGLLDYQKAVNPELLKFAEVTPAPKAAPAAAASSAPITSPIMQM